MIICIKKKKGYIITLLIILLFCLGVIFYKCIGNIKNKEFIAGASLVNTVCKEDKKVVATQSEEEKFFRPSKLPVLNINKDTEKLINDYYNKGPESVKLSKEFFKTQKDTILNYFSLLREAANPVEGKNAGCGSLGWGKVPYKIAYKFLTNNYQKKISFKEYEDSFLNILHINLIKLKEILKDSEHGDDLKYFYEIETIQGSDNKAANFAYYYGYVYLSKIGDEYKISDINIIPENYLCAPYHGWAYDGEMSVQIRYGDWCNLIKAMGKTEVDGYVKNIYFKGNDDKEYKIEFYTLTNDNDIEVAQYIKNNEGEWINVKLDSYKCLDKEK